MGGGAIARRRAEVLTRFGGAVTVIAPAWLGGVPGVRWERRAYAPGDLAGAFLAVAATGDRRVNRRVGEEARALGIPVSVADRREECSFFFPAVCQGGGVTAGLVLPGGGRSRPDRPGRPGRAEDIGGIGLKTLRAGRPGEPAGRDPDRQVMEAVRRTDPSSGWSW